MRAFEKIGHVVAAATVTSMPAVVIDRLHVLRTLGVAGGPWWWEVSFAVGGALGTGALGIAAGLVVVYIQRKDFSSTAWAAVITAIIGAVVSSFGVLYR